MRITGSRRWGLLGVAAGVFGLLRLESRDDVRALQPAAAGAGGRGQILRGLLGVGFDARASLLVTAPTPERATGLEGLDPVLRFWWPGERSGALSVSELVSLEASADRVAAAPVVPAEAHSNA
jgi:hypothetical protein